MRVDGTSESALWSPGRRNFTVGLVLVITLAAFEAMGIGTALPTIVRELHAEQWYSWPFTVFLAASAIGNVVGGRIADRRGPGAPLLVAMPTFGLGLLIAGFATDMPTCWWRAPCRASALVGRSWRCTC